MASRKRTILSVVAFLVYGLVVFLVYLYATFPYDLVQQRLTRQWAQGDIQIKMHRVGPSRFPPGLRIDDLRVLSSDQTLPGDLLQLRSLRLLPDAFPWFSGRWRLRLEGALYSGQLSGTVRLPSADQASVWEAAGRFHDLQIGQYALFQRRGSAFVRGTLGGDLSLTLDQLGRVRQGEASLRLDSVAFSGAPWQLPMQQDIVCDSIKAQIKMFPRQMQLVSFACRGNDFSLEARGSIAIRQPWLNSALNLRVQLRSENVYKQELAALGVLVRRRPDRRGSLQFSIRGTVRAPRLGA